MPLNDGQVFTGQGERFRFDMGGGLDPEDGGSSKIYLFGTEENLSTAKLTPPSDTGPGAGQAKLGQDMDLRALNIEFEQEDGALAQMVARGWVVMVSQDTTLDCHVLYYMPKRDKMVAEGKRTAQAHFKRLGTEASCDRLQIFLAEEKYVMKGNVTVKENDSVMQGEYFVLESAN